MIKSALEISGYLTSTALAFFFRTILPAICLFTCYELIRVLLLIGDLPFTEYNRNESPALVGDVYCDAILCLYQLIPAYTLGKLW